jgi:hypothetical protein
MAMMLGSLLPILVIMPFQKETPLLIVTSLLITAAMWFLFIRWALSKSEVINIDDLLAERRARKRESRRR